MSKNTSDDPSVRRGRSKSSTDEQAEADNAILVIDYNGMAASVEGQTSVPHIRSPYIVWWPENGRPHLILQPGVNLVDAKIWRFYTAEANDGKGATQLMEKIEAGQITVIKGLPRNEQLLLSLIHRTISHDGLEWLLKQEQSRSAGERQHIVNEIGQRAAKANPVKMKPITFQATVPMVPGMKNEYRSVEPTLAMG